MKLRHFAVFGGIFTVIICLLLFLFIVTADDEENSTSYFDFSGLNLSEEVLKHQPTVEKYATEYGISDYVNYLLANMQVETGGTATDVMQSSESMGLPPNSLSTEESIKQGCKYFSELLKSAEAKGCDIDTVVQAYNYGGGFIDYVAKHGKKYTFELAVSFAKDKSGGVKVTYKNEISIKENGGWRFYKDDGSGEYVSDKWQQDGDKWYWFDGAGMMVHDTWYQYKGSWYYLGSDGAMLKGLQTINGKWYYLDQTGRMATEPVVLTPDQDGALHYPGLVK